MADCLEPDVYHARLGDNNVLTQLGHRAEEPRLDLAISRYLRDGLRDGVELRLFNYAPVVEVGHRTRPRWWAAMGHTLDDTYPATLSG